MRPKSASLADTLIVLVAMLAPQVASADEAAEPETAAEALPGVLAPSAVVMDVATGAKLFGKDARSVVGIASTTKIFVAMVVRRRGIDLEASTAITRVDRDHARGGARTRLEVHHSFKNIDLLRAMLIASDNRAPTALGRAVDLDPPQLVAAMNELARELGLPNTQFTDPSGLRGNVSTATEMALAFKIALEDPVLAEIMGTREVTVRSSHSKPLSIYYRNTNDALHAPRYQVLAGKTGFTRMAGYCLIIAARVAGRDVVMVFLGEKHKRTRYADFGRVVDWLAGGHAPALDTLPVITGAGSIIRAAASGEGSL